MAISFIIHMALIMLCDLQDHYLHLKYTDIDYIVFSDAAQHILNGSSPFDRPTYRYSPILAYFMIPNHLLFPQFGKVLFSLFDVLGGYLLYRTLVSENKSFKSRIYHLLWLYNPLTLIISTRGSCESMICTMVILVLYLLIKKHYLMAGLCFGFVVHFKIYPIIRRFSHCGNP